MFTRSVTLLLASLVALGGWLWIGAKPFVPEPLPPSPADEFTVSGPFTHGNLTVFLLHGPDAERSRPVLGLDEALARKCAVVHETGNVGELTVENTSEEDDLLLLSGDIVKGGRQDRVLQATMILPPKSGKVPVRSFCVEQSRWTKRGGEDDTRFSGNTQTIAGKDLKWAVQSAGSQGEVWRNVATQQAGLSRNVGAVVNSAESPTSLQLALENEKVQAEVAKFREAITAKVGNPTGAVGFVTVVNGQVSGAEAFGSHGLFQKAWAKAVTAAAVEAVAEKAQRPFGEMTPDGVRAFLANAGRESERARQLDERLTGLVFDVTASTPFESTAYPVGHDSIAGVMDGSTIRSLQQQSSAPMRMQTNRALRNHGPDNFDEGNLIDFDAQWVNRSGRGFGVNEPRGVQLEEKKSAVVEYREKGTGAVIHKSFLAK